MVMDSLKIIEIFTRKNGIIDREAIASVGMLCAEIEVLEKNKSLTLVQIKSLFKELSKNTIYEQSRVLKKLLRAMAIPSVTFISKSKED